MGRCLLLCASWPIKEPDNRPLGCARLRVYDLVDTLIPGKMSAGSAAIPAVILS